MPWYMRLFFALPRRVRAVLDPNDHSHADLWRAAGLHAAVPHLESLELASRSAALAELRATYALRPPSSGRVLAAHELRRFRRLCAALDEDARRRGGGGGGAGGGAAVQGYGV